MSEQTATPTLELTQTDELLARFPEAITPDARKGYQGYIVQAENLIEVATALRDEFGYDYLANLCGVDYLPEGKMEVVYNLFRSTGGSGLSLKVQTPRDDSVVPSLYSVFPGADLQERETYDMLGIRFEGHPDLRRYCCGKASTVTRCARIGARLFTRKKANLSRHAGRMATSPAPRISCPISTTSNTRMASIPMCGSR